MGVAVRCKMNRLSEEELLPRSNGFAVQCLICGVVQSANPGWTSTCRCGNFGVDVDAGRLSVGDSSQVVWFAIQTPGRTLGDAAPVEVAAHVPGVAVDDPDRTLARCPMCKTFVACGAGSNTACRCDNLWKSDGNLRAREGTVELWHILVPALPDQSDHGVHVRLSDGSESAAPTEAELRELLRALQRPDVYFAILQSGPQSYIQTYRQSPGQFELQVRVGGPESHYELATPVSLQEVENAFVEYLRDPRTGASLVTRPGWRPLET